jgi:tripartite-type tricarboxylate transporter receptor subunit TctC
MVLASSAAVFPMVDALARAQTYPTRPVRILVGFPPGGALDFFARMIGRRLGQRLGQAFLVENRPGAATNVATEEVVRASPDGYTTLMFSSSAFTNAALYRSLNFNFIRDVAPVASIIRGPLVMVVNPSLPVGSVSEFVAYVKSRPGKCAMASAGTGSATHVAGKLFEQMSGIEMLHVPYRGDAPALADMLAGRTDVYFGPLTGSIEYIRTNRLRALAVTTLTRAAILPDVPALAQFVPGYEASLYNGVGVPRLTPVEVVEVLNKEINLVLDDPIVQARFEEMGVAAYATSPSEFGKLIRKETEKWGEVIKTAGIRLD